MKYRFTISGVTPLLMCWDNVEGADVVEAWIKDPKNKKLSKAGDDRSPAWTWIYRMYHDGTRVTMPSLNIQTSLRQAATMITLKGMKTFKESSQSGIWFQLEQYPLLVNGKEIPIDRISTLLGGKEPFSDHAAVVKELGFRLDVRRAQSSGRGGKTVRVRPRFDNWAITGEVHVLVPEVTDEIIRSMFTLAGKHKGIGDWRPGAPKGPGRWGMFEADLELIES